LKKTHAITLVLTLISGFCYSQTPVIPKQALDTVVITSSRIKTDALRLPASVSLIKGAPEDATRQQLSLQEFVQGAPGVFAQNANNFAQDLRISIRGFGARSSFGIRGIKLIVDGIPETTPDGQGQLDNINLGIIDRIEVTKGPSSSLYGNASGGVIDITTLSYASKRGNFSSFKGAAGGYGFQNYQATAVVGDSLASYIFHGNYTTSNGFRSQSGFEQINTNFKGAFRLRENVRLTAIVNYADSPQAQDAGGLTLEEVREDRIQARQRNVDFATEEAVQQFKVGASLAWQKSKSTQIDGYAFYSNRRFDGKLPFEFGGVVDLGRDYVGQGASIQYTSRNNRIKIGYDFGYQQDGRQRFRNLEAEIGERTLNQDEKFTNFGIYLLDHYQRGKWYVTGGLRFDYNKLAVSDNFLSNGDDSGDRTLNAINPSIGVSYLLNNVTLFTNFATSFETPSLSELSANPSGEQGFNDDLEAQKASSFEVGIKGKKRSFQYQLTFFHIKTRDELVPFELEAFPDRAFFRNAGKTTRNGLEVEGKYTFARMWTTQFSYAYSDFTYDTLNTENRNETEDFSLPGIPKHKTFISLRYGLPKGLHVTLTANLVGSQFADDNNQVEVAAYEVLNLRMGYNFDFRNAKVRPYLGFNNLLDQKYTDNVRINAFGGRYYEPAPGFNMFGGIVLEF